VPRARTAQEALEAEIKALDKERETLGADVEKMTAQIDRLMDVRGLKGARLAELATLIEQRTSAIRLLNGEAAGVPVPASEEAASGLTSAAAKPVPQLSEEAKRLMAAAADDEDDDDPKPTPQRKQVRGQPVPAIG
jgi:chromosome segregation ATPase